MRPSGTTLDERGAAANPPRVYRINHAVTTTTLYQAVAAPGAVGPPAPHQHRSLSPNEQRVLRQHSGSILTYPS
jgi:hypothetical protein